MFIYLFIYLLVGQQGAFKLTFEVMRNIIELGYEKMNINDIWIFSSREFFRDSTKKTRSRKAFSIVKSKKSLPAVVPALEDMDTAEFVEVSALGFEIT